MRESFWAGGGLLDEETPRSTTSPLVVRAWLLAKASIGRLGLPSKPRRAGEQATREIVDFIQRGSVTGLRGILNKVRDKYAVTTLDENYWRMIEASGAAGI